MRLRIRHDRRPPRSLDKASTLLPIVASEIPLPRSALEYMRGFLAMAMFAATAWAQADPYGPLRAKQYDVAIANFEKAIAAQPERSDLRIDLAYTLLKIGETAEARDQFAEAMRVNPSDDHIALEYAFLCYETKEQVAARRTFDLLRQKGNATAAEAFENIDKPLREGIARWQAAVNQAPEKFQRA